MKQIAKTPAILASLRAAFGEAANLDDLVVYEAVAANSNPLRKPGGIFKGAKISQVTLTQMAAAIQAESIPLQTQHDTDALPSGRVFEGKMHGSDLHVLFAVNKAKADLVRDLDSGIIDQVSVGILAKELNCSACGFDYMGAKASIMNFLEATCPDGHAVGQDGVFVHFTSLAAFHEMSLVGKGAVPGARVVDPADSAFAAHEHFQRLAASGVPAAALILNASATTQEPSPMDKEFVEKLEAGATERAELKATNTALTAQVTELTGARDAEKTRADAAEAKVVELTAQVDAAPKAEDLTAAVTSLKEIATRILVASGEQTPSVPDTVTELNQLIKDKGAELAAILPVGGRSKPADALDADTKSVPASNRAFSTRA
jgi:hypothetical protein